MTTKLEETGKNFKLDSDIFNRKYKLSRRDWVRVTSTRNILKLA
jgi:hypothetical protein